MRPDSYSRPEGQLSHGLSSLIATGERNQAQLQISKFKWGFVAKEQGEGSDECETTRREDKSP